MVEIKSTTGKEDHEVIITSGSGHTIISDEPIDVGGKNKGMSPSELLISALTACTTATIQMYVNLKGWKLNAIHIHIKWEKESAKDLGSIHREIELEGDLSEEQRERILRVANKCPIHRVLTNPMEITTALK